MATTLLSRKTPPPFKTGEETYKGLCARCHGEKGDGKGVNVIYLDPAPRDLTKAAFMTTKPEERFLTSHQGRRARNFDAAVGASSDDEQTQGRARLCVHRLRERAARELKTRKVPETNPVAYYAGVGSTRRSRSSSQRCTGCHGRKADGKGPNSLDISPRPRNLRNSAFINNATDQRLFESITYGVEGTAMPSWMDYGLTQNDVGESDQLYSQFEPQAGDSSSRGKVAQAYVAIRLNRINVAGVEDIRN